jgi:hypothetical protein
MTPSKKTIATLMAVSLAVGLMVGISVQFIDAQVGGNPLTEKRVGPKTPKAYGGTTAGIVCGDKLCNADVQERITVEDTDVQELDTDPSHMPDLKLQYVHRYKDNSARNHITYTVGYQITCGTEALANVHVEINSDTDSEDYVMQSCAALKTSQNVARIKAMDADSIHIEVTGYQLAPPTSSGPGGTTPFGERGVAP